MDLIKTRFISQCATKMGFIVFHSLFQNIWNSHSSLIYIVVKEVFISVFSKVINIKTVLLTSSLPKYLFVTLCMCTMTQIFLLRKNTSRWQRTGASTYHQTLPRWGQSPFLSDDEDCDDVNEDDGHGHDGDHANNDDDDDDDGHCANDDDDCRDRHSVLWVSQWWEARLENPKEVKIRCFRTFRNMAPDSEYNQVNPLVWVPSMFKILQIEGLDSKVPMTPQMQVN